MDESQMNQTLSPFSENWEILLIKASKWVVNWDLLSFERDHKYTESREYGSNVQLKYFADFYPRETSILLKYYC